MITIYCIEDCNSLKYVGSTKKKLYVRLSNHKTDKKRKSYCSSCKLNLDNCKIYSLETCNESDKHVREKYWINKIECVNDHKLDSLDKVKIKQYNNKYFKEYYLFRSKKVVNGCYEFIKMLEQY